MFHPRCKSGSALPDGRRSRVSGYLIRRVLGAFPTLLGITLLTFLFLEILPGREMALAQANSGRLPAAETLERLRATYHLDEPVARRYLQWLLRICRWDLGDSLLDHRPVTESLRAAALRTFVLNLASLALALIISFPLGIYWAGREGS